MLFKVAFNDFRLVFRDNSLKIFILLPLLILLVIRYGVPYVAGVYAGLQSYVFVILMLATLQGAIAFGFIYSMVLVDEKDSGVAKVYGILPVSKFWFVAFRLIPPFILAQLSTVALLSVEPFYHLPLLSVLVYSALAGLVAPLMALFVAAAAENKIEAMTWQKIFNLPLFLPVFAFFIPASFTFVFAIFPTFWTYQGFNLLIEGKNAAGYLLIGFVYNISLILLMIKRFIGEHFR